MGVLSFAASCVREGRLFFSRLLSLLKSAGKSKRIPVSHDAKKDIAWWNVFVQDYNGVSLIPSNCWSAPDKILSTDSCLSGGGAVSQTHFMHFELPASIIMEGKYINQFEMYVVLIAIRNWKESLSGQNVLLYCDNQTTIIALQSGRVSCPFMQKCLREIRFHSAKLNFRVRAVYLASADNCLADSLSRWHLSPKYKDIFMQENKRLRLKEAVVSNFEIKELW